MTKCVQVVVMGDGRARAYSPYEAREVLKAAVPSSMRRWDKARKCWHIKEQAVPWLAEALRAFGYTVFVTDAAGDPYKRPGTKPQGFRSTPSPQWVEDAFRECPVSSVDKLRRGLMAAFHPDAGGSLDLAQRINAAADRRQGKGPR